MGNSRILQAILGFFLGVFFVVSGLGAFGYFLWSRFAITPTKPIFAEEKKPKTTPKLIAKISPQVTPKTPSPTASKTPDPLPKGAYKARVIWSEGLSVRSGPSRENESVGGVSYNEELIVLEKSEDGNWSKVRSTKSNVEGWVKSGNLSNQETAESPSPSPSPEATKTPDPLPQGSYKAKVKRSGGLTVRSGPSRSNESVGGVGYNDELIVLEKDSDGTWVKVRSVQTGVEGWVKSGNLSNQE